MRAHRVAFLTSHPIQYQVPLFRALARRPEIDLTVLFCSDQGLREYRDVGFASSVKWDAPLLGGYRHAFLTNVSPLRNGHRPFLKVINPGILPRLRGERFEVLIVHGWAHATSWLAFAGAYRAGMPLLLRGESTGLREPGGVKGILKRRVLGWLFGRAAGCLAIGTLNRRFYRRHGVADERIFFAPYAVDNDFFRAAADKYRPLRDRLRREERIPTDACVFLFCGKLTPVKRPLDLVEAFTALPANLATCLLFVGDGPLRDAVETLAHGRHDIRVTGFRNQGEVPRYYALADVLVLPSAFEPWGLVVNEALNFGLPIIASDQVGCAVDLVRPRSTGEVVAVGDIQGLARAMLPYAVAPPGRRPRAALDVIEAWGVTAAADGIVKAVVETVRKSA